MKIFLHTCLTLLMIFQSFTNVFGSSEVMDKKEYEMIIEKGNTDFLKFELPQEVYENTKSLNSFYITAYDKSTEEYVNIPYFIEKMSSSVVTTNSEYNTEFIKKVTDEEGRVVNFIFRVTDDRGYDLKYNKIRFVIDRESYSNVLTISGSHDNIEYDTFVKEYIFNTTQDKKDVVEFETFVDYEYLKFTWLDIDEDALSANIDDIFVTGESENIVKAPFEKEINLDFTQEDKEEGTILTIDIVPITNHNVANVYFDAKEEYFTREVYAYTPNYMTYEISKDSNREPYLIFDKVPKVLTIKNGYDEPLNIENIVATIDYQYVIFENKYKDSNNYILNFNNYDTDVKEYDISMKSDEILAMDIARVNVSSFTQLEDSEAEGFINENNSKLLLNSSLILLVGVLVYLGFTSFKK